MTTEAKRVYDWRMVPLELVDDPDIAMRETFDEEAMADLVDSVRDHGILENLVLVARGDRFVISAGHRRSVAARYAGLTEVPALVFPEGTDPESAKVHENAFREDVNPAHEAMYYKQLLETRCGNDTIQLANLVKRKLTFVEQRLSLIFGYPEVFDALRQQTITMAVAQELNKYGDHKWMLTHLDAAIAGGVKASVVRNWRAELERMPNLLGDTDNGGPALPASQLAPPPTMSCCVCSESHDPYNLEFMYIHRGGPCKNMLDRALNRLGGA